MKQINLFILGRLKTIEMIGVLMRVFSFSLVSWLGPHSPFMFVWIFNTTIGRHIAEWDEAPETPRAAKIAGLVSLVLWAAIVAAGRAIAYSLPPPS